MESGKHRDNDEWRLVHKLMGQTNAQQLRRSFTQSNPNISGRPIIDYTVANSQARQSKLVKSRRLEEIDSKQKDTDILESAAFIEKDPYDQNNGLKPKMRTSDDVSDVDRNSHDFDMSLKRHQLNTNEFPPNY